MRTRFPVEQGERLSDGSPREIRDDPAARSSIGRSGSIAEYEQQVDLWFVSFAGSSNED